MEIPSAGFLARKACLHDCSSQLWRAGACPNFSVDRKGDSLDCREGTFFGSALPFHAFFPLNTSECCIASGKRSLAIIWNGRFSRKLVSVSSMNGMEISSIPNYKASFCELDELDHHRAPAVPQEIECRAAIMAATSTSKVGSPIDMHPYAAQH